MIRRIALLILIESLLLSSSKAEDDFMIRDGDTVGFLGDSITAARTYGKIIENYTLLRYPTRKVRFINLGVGGDTAADGLKRLQRDVFDQQVTLLLVAFGINDIGWGAKADDDHRQLYLKSIHEIVTQSRERGIRVVICSAAATARDPDESENDFLQQMCEEGMAAGKEAGASTIHVLQTMRDIQRRMQQVNESRSKENQQTLHLDDGIHLNDLGQLAMAYAILTGLGAPPDVSSCVIDAATGQVEAANSCTITDVTSGDHALAFTRVDDALPFNNGLFATLSYATVPMDQISGYRLTVRNLMPGRYELTVSGRVIGIWGSERLASGLDIASVTPDPWKPGGPWDAQATVLKSLTEARHEIDTAVRASKTSVPDSPSLQPLIEQSARVTGELEQMQRIVARPQSYRFELRRVGNETALRSPLEFQVFQRQSRNRGHIFVSGTTLRNAEKVRIQFQGKPLAGNLPENWLSLDVDRQSGDFSSTLPFPAGGWFSMNLEVLKAHNVIERQTIERFGVGEVFVGAGQSNSTNCGQFPICQKTGMVASFSGEHWQIADDPQPGVADQSKGGSYYPAFGDRLYDVCGVPIGIAATGYGGTSVNAWQPDANGLFRHMMSRIRQLGPNGFRAVLWHQGESDVRMPSHEYYQGLRNVIEASRSQAGWDIPWFVAQVSYLDPANPSFESTRKAQEKL